ncbi:MAG: Gfo/Idh/MocA family oxidoreductase [Clostridiales Family XIII bacterium]|jgi:predicted dehydrogenase|nr:Gfo/Idh/MocA family oxidoreductase [Clostridiales Family XIII bacterium]
MSGLNIGIIGCGSIARQRHAHEYKLNPNATIVGFYDFDRSRAESMTLDFGGKVFDTAEELISDSSIDAVSVCAANKYHAELTIDALNAGKHVLCEKPMAISLIECEAMVNAAKKSGKHLLIDQNQRLNNTHIKAKQILESGELGRVITFQSTFSHKGPESWSADKSANTWFFKKDAASFGSLADLGIHKIDLIRYLVGGKVKEVFSAMNTLHKTFPDGTPIEVDDNSVEILTFDDGTMGTVTTSWTNYGEENNSTIIYCEKGTMKIYLNPKYSLEIEYLDGKKTHYEIDRMQQNDDAQQTSSGAIDTFVSAILEDKKTPLDADDVIDSMRVVFACLDSSEKRVPISLT